MDKDDAPPIAALFHVVFDQKVGYTTAWQCALPDIYVDGVEYKSLPSGLHGVKNDLVHFVHEGKWLGVSAFAQAEADSKHRNAAFSVVGALVPLSYGSLAEGWLQAPGLLELAKGLLRDGEDKRALERYWKNHMQDQHAHQRPPSSPEGRIEGLVVSLESKPGRGQFDAGLKVDNELFADHPSLYISPFLHSLGPLILPLYRAALLRKRILLLGAPPVLRNCNTVYILSVLSSIPSSLSEVLQPSTEPLFRIQPLFSVGIPDITSLIANDSKSGWVATTTDDILGEKHQLYDLLVELAPETAGPKRRWPRLRTSDGKIIRATQRDLRRYRLLRNELKRMRIARQRYTDTPDPQRSSDTEAEDAPLLSGSQLLEHSPEEEEMLHGEDEPEVVEPQTWASIAYNSFLWWASAGSADEPAEAEDETKLDRELLSEVADLHSATSHATPLSSEDEKRLDAQEVATVLTAYFHRLTARTLQRLAKIAAEADNETEEGVEDDAIAITADDMRAMSLDPWSEQDRVFVKEAIKLYFGREANVAEVGVQLCGMRIC